MSEPNQMGTYELWIAGEVKWGILKFFHYAAAFMSENMKCCLMLML